LVAAFREGLRETGFVEGQNVVIEYSWADDQNGRLPALTADLVRDQVAAIAAVGGEPSAFAAKAATSSPIVFIAGSDPVTAGLVVSMARPGGNMTGVNMFTIELQAKRLGLLNDPTESNRGAGSTSRHTCDLRISRLTSVCVPPLCRSGRQPASNT
jgi:putative ABC transport system substrate-binding protein